MSRRKAEKESRIAASLYGGEQGTGAYRRKAVPQTPIDMEIKQAEAIKEISHRAK